MRAQINKSSSTKAERQFSEILKRHKIPFKFRAKVMGKEVDFLVGMIAIEIGDHTQNVQKNSLLIQGGYSLVFFTNKWIREDIKAVEKHLIVNWLKK